MMLYDAGAAPLRGLSGMTQVFPSEIIRL